MKNRYPIELLAPAKDLECGYAAIDSGADAVYIGASRFGAREKAGNPLNDIAQLVRYAQIYWCKIYVVINTILKNDEIKPAVRLINKLYDIGVDALIIQDFALLECDLPPIPLIASTQMHNNTLERVRFLENVGFQRAILARELSLDEIKLIRNQTRIELEVFVHGALCVSYSGRCYMSYAIGGRSGNRGECAQPCRRRYSLVNADNNTLVRDKHLLSLKDLNRLLELEDLIDAGITSFKIEGRLKDKIYVTNVVSQYRQRIDDIIKRQGLKASSSGHVNINFTPDVTKTFNRGYTSYFLRERDIKPGATDTPKMKGKYIGWVKSVNQRLLTISGDTQISPGDGMCWNGLDGELQGSQVNQVKGRTIILNQSEGIKIGTQLFRNYDHAFYNEINKNQPVRKIETSLILKDIDVGYELTAIDEDKNSVFEVLEREKIKAVKAEQARNIIQRQLTRMGGTPYICNKLEIQCSGTPFIPIAQLNALRRTTLQALTRERIINKPVLKNGTILSQVSSYPEQHLEYFHNVLNSYADSFLRRHGVLRIEPAAESGLNMKGRVVMRCRQCIKRQLGRCSLQNPNSHYDQPLFLIDEDGHHYPLNFDCEQCEMEVIY